MRIRRRIVAMASATTVAAVVAALALTASANAHPAPDGRTPAVGAPAGVAPAMFTALQRDLHLTPAQARARLISDAKASKVLEVLDQTFGTRYGGTWVASDGTLTVGVVSDAQATAARALGARPVRVARSEAQLNGAVERLNHAGRVPAGINSWYADTVHGTIVIEAHADRVAAARAFAKAAGVDPSSVQVKVNNATPKPYMDVIGGNAYYINGNTRCSVGFSVPGGFISAGHCGRAGDRTTNPSGTFRASTFPGNDWSWIQVDAGNTPRGLVNRYPGTVAVAGHTEAPIGASVCRSGSTSGWHCGTILEKNATVTYQEGTVRGLTHSNACAEPGDSGGSWLAGDQAQGVTSGGSGDCTSGGDMYFQPVNPILTNYGLSLVIEGGGGGGGGGGTTPPQSPPPGGSTTWAPYTAYSVGSQVTYNGVGYVCLQAHTSLPGWEPPIVPALWQAD